MNATKERVGTHYSTTIRPWRATPDGSVLGGDNKLIYQATTVRTLAQNGANATFIALACNAHDDLLAALTDLVNEVTAIHGKKARSHNGPLYLALCRSDAAIRKADQPR